jgi:hypothetical protein
MYDIESHQRIFIRRFIIVAALPFHLSGANTHGWELRSPLTQGLNSTGVGFFATTFSLRTPHRLGRANVFAFHAPDDSRD